MVRFSVSVCKGMELSHYTYYWALSAASPEKIRITPEFHHLTPPKRRAVEIFCWLGSIDRINLYFSWKKKEPSPRPSNPSTLLRITSCSTRCGVLWVSCRIHIKDNFCSLAYSNLNCVDHPIQCKGWLLNWFPLSPSYQIPILTIWRSSPQKVVSPRPGNIERLQLGLSHCCKSESAGVLESFFAYWWLGKACKTLSQINSVESLTLLRSNIFRPKTIFILKQWI